MFSHGSVSKAGQSIRAILSVFVMLAFLMGLPVGNVSAERANAPLAAIDYTQFAMLTATDSGTNAHFGSTLAIDHDVAVVGVPDATVGNSNGQGAVYVFYRDQGGLDKWGQVTKLVASNGAAGDHFGYAVAISGDTIVVGAKDATKVGDPKAYNAGTVYAFQRNFPTSNAWGETQKLTASDGQKNDRFGTAVAIHDNVVFVGSPYEDPQGGSNNSGSAYLFVRSSAEAPFSQVGKFSASYTSSTVGDRYGTAMALDGITLVVGAPMMKLGSNQGQGMAYVYSYYEDAAGNYQFTNTAQLKIDAGLANDNFGKSVAISNNIIAIGAPSTISSPTGGAAYLYKHNQAGGWDQIKKEVANPSQVGNRFGASVALDGDLFAVGAPDDDVNSIGNAGAIYLFARNQDGLNSWNQVGSMSVIDGSSAANDEFGTTTGISGATVLGGVPYKSLQLSGQGAVYVLRASFQLEIDLNGPGGSSIDYYTKYTEDSAAINITDPTATITSTTGGSLDKMVITLGNMRDAGLETLSATASGAITQANIQYDAVNGILTVDPAGVAPLADFVAVLRSVKYLNTSQSPDPLDRVVRFWVTDGTTGNMQEPGAYITVVPVPDVTSTTILSTNPDIPHINQPFTVNFQVTSAAGTPSGDVTVTVNGENVTCKGTLDASGRGSCTMTVHKDGNFSLSAQYAGDIDFLTSTSTPYMYEVIPYSIFLSYMGK